MSEQLSFNLFAESSAPVPMPAPFSPSEDVTGPAEIPTPDETTAMAPPGPDNAIAPPSARRPSNRTDGCRLPTLADVISRLNAAGDLPGNQRRDLLSAVRKTVDLLQRDADLIAADLSALRSQLQQLRPGRAISAKRLANVRADLVRAFQAAGVAEARLPSLPMSAAWRALMSDVGTPARWRLSRLASSCNDRGIDPEEVDTAVIDQFTAHLEASSLVARPDRVRRLAVAAWNDNVAGKLIARGKPLDPRVKDRRTTLPIEMFPTTFQADIDSWIARLAGEDLFDDAGLTQSLRPASLKYHRYQIRRAATAAVRTGTPTDELRSLADLVAPARAKAILRWLRDRYGKQSHVAHQVARVLKAVATHHVRLELEQVDWFRKLCKGLKIRRVGLTEKNRTRLRAFDDPQLYDRLITLPQRLMREAARDTGQSAKAAWDAQMAVAIELLLMTPIRISNLASIRPGVNLLMPRDRSGPTLLYFAAAQTKNSQELEYELPAESAELIRRFLKDYHRRLAPGGSDYLFPRLDGREKSSSTLGRRITLTIRRHLGCDVHPHLLRHLGAKQHLEAHPGEYEVVRRVLGHKSIDTTTQYYTGMETIAAARQFDSSLLARRRKAEARLGLRSPKARR